MGWPGWPSTQALRSRLLRAVFVVVQETASTGVAALPPDDAARVEVTARAAVAAATARVAVAAATAPAAVTAATAPAAVAAAIVLTWFTNPATLWTDSARSSQDHRVWRHTETEAEKRSRSLARQPYADSYTGNTVESRYPLLLSSSSAAPPPTAAAPSSNWSSGSITPEREDWW